MTRVCACGGAKAYQAKTCRACFKRSRPRQPAWRERNLDESRAYLRARMLKRKYNLTPEQWDARFEAQGCRCACCGTDKPGMRSGWSTDHDHGTGRVRGIVCYRCNRTLGFLGDNAEGVRASAAQFECYLRGGFESGLGEGLLA